MLDELDLLQFKWFSRLWIFKEGSRVGIRCHDIGRGNHFSNVDGLSRPFRTVGRQDADRIHDNEIRLSDRIDIRDALVEVDLMKLFHVPYDADKVFHPQREFRNKMLLKNRKVDEDIKFKNIPDNLGLFQFSPLWDIHLFVNIPPMA